LEQTNRFMICDMQTPYSPKYIVILVWWDSKIPIYFDILPRNQTISSGVYIQQLIKLNNYITENRPELANRKQVVFQHYNARQHSSLVPQQILFEFGWDLLSHSPDLTPLYWDQPMTKPSTGKSLWEFEIDGKLKNPYEDFSLSPKLATRFH